MTATECGPTEDSHTPTISPVHRNVPLLYAYYVLARATQLCAPVVFLYWRQQGLSETEVGFVEGSFALVALVFEIPSGYFADHFGRRASLALAGGLFATSMAAYGFLSGWPMIICGEFSFGAALAFLSGADAAMLYDTLLAQGRAERFRAIWGSILGMSMLAMAVFTAAGGWAADTWAINTPWLIALPIVALTVPAALLMREPPRTRPTEALSHYAQIARLLREVLVEDRELRRVVLSSALLFTAFMGPMIFYQPWFQQAGLELKHFGLIYAAFNLMAAAAAHFAYRIEAYLGRRIDVALYALLAAGHVGMALFVTPWGWVFALLSHQVVRGVYRVSVASRVNALTGSTHRATVLSIQSFIGSAVYALAVLLLGMLADRGGVTAPLWALGVFCVVLAGLVLFIAPRGSLQSPESSP
jgi:MFS family permease